MLIILYSVRHERTHEEIELCGEFKDFPHFLRCAQLEKERGWITFKNKVIKENVESIFKKEKV